MYQMQQHPHPIPVPVPEFGVPMKFGKVGNQTNSQDPQAVNSRIFVGNLNTFQCSKNDVEKMFQRYGRIAGISMHKGYAFVQFTNPFDARSACLGEDGRPILSQILDVNMVAEPKPHQTGRKRLTKTNLNDWDYYYDSYYSAIPPRVVPPVKRPRLVMPQGRAPKNMATATATMSPPISVPIQTIQPKAFLQPTVSMATASTSTATPPPPVAVASTSTATNDQIKLYSNPDILICGNCREMFTDLNELLDHKKSYCKLRFTCKCNSLNGIDFPSDRKDAAALLCVQCKDPFVSAWDLMVHVQAAHMVNIYELGVPKCSNGTQYEESPLPRNGMNDDGVQTVSEEDFQLMSPGSDKDQANGEEQKADDPNMPSTSGMANKNKDGHDHQ